MRWAVFLRSWRTPWNSRTAGRGPRLRKIETQRWGTDVSFLGLLPYSLMLFFLSQGVS